MVDVNFCYKLCDIWYVPILTLLTFIWTVYQEIRHRIEKKQNGK